ncbi:hypothetical protein ScPMuIL_009822 [Solemya velum]
MPSPDLGCKPSRSESGSEWAPTPKRARHPPTSSSEKRATRMRSPHLGTDGHMLPRQYMYHPTEDGLSRWMAARPSSGSVGHCPPVQWLEKRLEQYLHSNNEEYGCTLIG